MASELEVRLEKRKALEALGRNPHPDRFARTHTLKQARELPLDTGGVRLAGRIMALRHLGQLTFVRVQDLDAHFQLALSRELLGNEEYERFLSLSDIGDFVGAEGKIFRTKRGELTLEVIGYQMLGKTLRPLPEKWHGLQDQETCYRKRYLDLLMNEETRKAFRTRFGLLRYLRHFLEDNGFVEVETPVLQNKASGALATPFRTWHKTLDIDLFLRIAPETYLKRCIVGGFDRVYEFARCFRNEGMDSSHLQDFTLLEFYAAYWNYEDNMDFTERMVKGAVQELAGGETLNFKGQRINFGGTWPRRPMREMIQEKTGLDLRLLPDVDKLRAEVRRRVGDAEKEIDRMGWGSLVDLLYKKTVRPFLKDPIFLIHHPVALSPLARRDDRNPEVADRFQLVICGWEVVNAYSELVDPIDQRARLVEQASLRAAGDEEAMDLDEDYLYAMEHGMPPISGWGMGIDRMAALLAGRENLRDVVLFPLMKSADEAVPGEAAPEAAPAGSPAPGASRGTPAPVPAGEPLLDFGMIRERALELLREKVKAENHIKHSLSSAAVMRALAGRLGENPAAWEMLGLLHDLDFDVTDGKPAEHGRQTAAWLEPLGVPRHALQAILAHNAEGTGVPRATRLDVALTCGETVTGLVVATALISPDRKLAAVTGASVLKRMKKKDFARNVSRENIARCESLGVPLPEFLDLAVKALQGIAGDLGL